MSARLAVSLIAGLVFVGGTPFAASAQQTQAPDMPTVSQPAAADTVSDAFRQVLVRYGSFVQHPVYGEVWVPTVTPQGWHPYPPCHWVRAKQLGGGLYFDDRTEWGAIVHHYGRWAHDEAMGWVWTPGSEFGPGWVAWRSSAAWTGWAPMPPAATDNATAVKIMDGADSWLFQETTGVLAACSATTAAPAEIPTLIETTPYLRGLTFVDGIAVVPAPVWLVGPFADLDIAIHPWSPWWKVKVLVQLNWIWNHTTIHIVKNVCFPTKKASFN